MTQFKTKKFLELKRSWYRKLKDEGFDDAESENNLLKEWHSRKFLEKTAKPHTHPKCVEARRDYYRAAQQYFHSFAFKTSLDEQVWELHSKGIAIRKIAGLCQNRSRNEIHLIIQRLRKEMGLR